MDERTKMILLEKLIELKLIEKKSEISESTFVDFENIIKGIEINTQTVDQMSRHLFGTHQKDRFETIIYYRFLMAENFSQLITDSVIKLKIEDYSNDPDLKPLIREYNDTICDYIVRMGHQIFLHSRNHF